jgi:hypothetical protein
LKTGDGGKQHSVAVKPLQWWCKVGWNIGTEPLVRYLNRMFFQLRSKILAKISNIQNISIKFVSVIRVGVGAYLLLFAYKYKGTKTFHPYAVK